LRANAQAISEIVDGVVPKISSSFETAAEAHISAGGDNSGVGVGLWDQYTFSRLCTRALLGCFIGKPDKSDGADFPHRKTLDDKNFSSNEWNEGWLSDDELESLLELVAAYRKRNRIRHDMGEQVCQIT